MLLTEIEKQIFKEILQGYLSQGEVEIVSIDELRQEATTQAI